MKSPTSSVGRIDDDGILNGSATNERSAKTIRSTGKKLFGYSIHQGSRCRRSSRAARSSLTAAARVAGSPACARSNAASSPAAAVRRRLANTARSSAYMTAQNTVARKRMSAKFIVASGARGGVSGGLPGASAAPGRRAGAFSHGAAERERRAGAARPRNWARASHCSPTLRIARKASCGISTLPTAFIRFLPAFCFSRSFFLRVMSPP